MLSTESFCGFPSVVCFGSLFPESLFLAYVDVLWPVSKSLKLAHHIYG